MFIRYRRNPDWPIEPHLHHHQAVDSSCWNFVSMYYCRNSNDEHKCSTEYIQSSFCVQNLDITNKVCENKAKDNF